MQKAFLLFIALAFFIVAFAAYPYSSVALTSSSIAIYVDNERVDFPDAKPLITQNNRTLVPLRFISDELGYTTLWNSKEKKVTIENATQHISLTINSTLVQVNNESFTLDTAPFVKDNRVYVPLRFISEVFGLKVDYVANRNSIFISSKTEPNHLNIYTLELHRWDVYNDGSHSKETTSGINKALVWAQENGYNVLRLPAGTYLIDGGKQPDDKNARINMVSNMILDLTNDAIIKKEANRFEAYSVVAFGPEVINSGIKGGQIIGDRYEHDYSQKDNENSSGTHEGGIGISLEGAKNITIENVKIYNLTGDGIAVGGTSRNTYASGLYSNMFEMGAIDEKGQLSTSTSKIRTLPLNLKDPMFKERPYINFFNRVNIDSPNYEVFFYNDNNQFISKASRTLATGKLIEIPYGATSVIAVFEAKSTKDVFTSWWNNDVSRNITIKNNDISYNRRQGITLGGVNNIKIDQNHIHHIGGTAPGYAIDAEGMGFFHNGNLIITSNTFEHNTGDIVFADGDVALVDHNSFNSEKGFYAWENFSNSTLTNNTFNDNGFGLGGSGYATNNVVNRGTVTLEGTNIAIENNQVNDGTLVIAPTEDFGVKINGMKLVNNGLMGNAIRFLNNKAVGFNQLDMSGETLLHTITVNGGSSNSIFNNWSIKDYNAYYGTSLPPGKYNYCSFSSSSQDNDGLNLNTSFGDFIIQNCVFNAEKKLINISTTKNVTIGNSKFTLTGDSAYLAPIVVHQVNDLTWSDNFYEVKGFTSATSPMIRVGSNVTPDSKLLENILFENSTFTSNLQNTIAVQTVQAGSKRAPYIFKNIILKNTILQLKANDQVTKE